MKKIILKKFDFITVAIIAGLVALLDIIGVVGLPTGVLSVSSLYIAAAFYLLFISYFKKRGVIGVYVGLLVSSFFTTGFSIMPVVLAWGNIIAPSLIFIVMKKMKVSFEFKKVKEIIIEVLLMIIASFVSAGWILGGYILFGIIPRSAFWISLIPWFLGDIIVYLFVGVPLMKYVYPMFKKFKI